MNLRTLSAEQLLEFARKLEAWSKGLLPEEQAFLGELLAFAASPETGSPQRW